MKDKIMRASLQRPVRLDYGLMLWRNSASLVLKALELEARYSLGSTVPDTRICLHFQPKSVPSVKGKHLSINTVHTVKHSSLPNLSKIVALLKPNDYVTC